MSSEGWQITLASLITAFVLALSLVLCLSPNIRVYRGGEGEEVQIWLARGWEVGIDTKGGESVDLGVRSEEDFLLVETFRSKVVPGGTVLTGLRAEDYFVEDFLENGARVESGSTFLMEEGEALLTIVSEGELTVKVWPSFSPNASAGGLLALLAVVVSVIVWFVLFALFRAGFR